MNHNQTWKSKAARFLTAQTISLFGSSIVQYAIIWYITITTSSGRMMTISTICGYLPQIAISLFAGVWLDRYDRKKIMMAADGMIALATLGTALAFISGYRSIWLLFLVLIIRSFGTGVQTPAVQALIPQIVPKEHLMKVNGINSTLSSFTIFLAPAVSGIVISILSIEATFFIDVITAVVGIGITMTVAVGKTEQKRQDEPAVNTMEELRSGFQYLRENRFVKQQIIYLILVAVLVSPSAFLTPLLVSRTFGNEVWKLTISEMSFSLGGILGGILIAYWGGFKNRRHTIILATLCYGMMMVGIGLSPMYMVYLIFNFLIGITMPCYNAPLTVALQERTDKQMHGRVFSMVQVANACALPFGTLIFGPLADRISIQLILCISGSAVVTLAVLSWKYKGFSEM